MASTKALAKHLHLTYFMAQHSAFKYLHTFDTIQNTHLICAGTAAKALVVICD